MPHCQLPQPEYVYTVRKLFSLVCLHRSAGLHCMRPNRSARRTDSQTRSVLFVLFCFVRLARISLCRNSYGCKPHALRVRRTEQQDALCVCFVVVGLDGPRGSRTPSARPGARCGAGTAAAPGTTDTIEDRPKHAHVRAPSSPAVGLRTALNIFLQPR